MKRFISRGVITLMCVVGLSAGWASAAESYGDLLGAAAGQVDFLNIQETSTTDPTPLFGEPMRAGNQLLFFPLHFASQSSGGASDLTSGTLSMTIVADDGEALTQIIIEEIGNYSLTGDGAGTWADVTGNLTLTYGAANQSHDLPISPEGPYTIGSGGWGGLTAIVLPAGVAQVDMTLFNVLSTSSEAGATATITKNVIGGPTVGITVIPEPASLTLLGLGGMALLKRNRKA